MSDPLALGVVVGYCGWDPTAEVIDATTKVNGTGTDLVLLPTLALASIASITATDVWGNISTLDPTADVEYNDAGEIELKPVNSANLTSWPVGKDNITIVWSGGNSSVPADLAAAITSITNRLPAMGLNRATIGTATLQYGPAYMTGDLLAVEKYVLDRYRIYKAA